MKHPFHGACLKITTSLPQDKEHSTGDRVHSNTINCIHRYGIVYHNHPYGDPR